MKEKKYTFRKGIHPKANKELSKSCPLKELETPDKVYIPLSQHIGAPAVCVVKGGDKVKCGSMLGKADGFISANIFSSVSGEVIDITPRPTMSGVKQCVAVYNDKKYEEERLPPLGENAFRAQIIERIKYAGIVGMGGAGFPTHVKLSPKKQVDTLIINGAECEPYLTCDYRLMLEKHAEIMEGIRILKIALNVERAVIAVEDNKSDAINLLRECSSGEVEVVSLKTKYPQGAEKQLIWAVCKKKVPLGGLPADVGVVVDNIHTAFSVYEAVREGKVSYMRAMTVSGGAAIPGNFFVRTGVPFSFIKDQCVPDDDLVAKIICGGPMMGFSLCDLNRSVGKGTSGLLFLTEKEVYRNKPSACINCARCRKACPMNLMPMFIDSCSVSGDIEGAVKYGAKACIECGSCAYVCPAKRQIVQSVRLAKKIAKEKGI